MLQERNLAVQKSEERYHTVVETSPDAIFVHANNHYLFANQATLRLFGAESLEQLCHHTVLEQISPEGLPMIRRRIEQTLKGNPMPRLVTRIIWLDAKEIPIESVTRLIEYQGRLAIQVMIHDISERKQIGAALRASEDTLFATRCCDSGPNEW